MKKTMSFIIVLVLVLSVSVSYVYAGTNLLANPSFEEDAAGKPAAWETGSWEKVSDFKYETGAAQEGTKFVTITNSKEDDGRYKQTVNVKENSMYKLSCWIKTENIPQGPTQKGANISIEGNLDTSADIFGTNGKWEYREIYARVGSGKSSLILTVGIGGYGRENTGKASFDNISVEEVTAIPDGAIVTDVKNKDNSTAQEPSSDGTSAPAKDSNNTAIWLLIIGVAVVLIVAIVFYKISNRKASENTEGGEDIIDNEGANEANSDDNDNNLI